MPSKRMISRAPAGTAGSFGYEMDLNKISEEEKEMVKEQEIKLRDEYIKAPISWPTVRCC